MSPHPNQLSLPGLELPPRAVPSPSARPTRKKFGGLPDRLFFGLRLEADVAAAARQVALRFQAKHRLKSYPRPAALLSVDFCSLGDYNGVPGGLVEAAIEAASSVEMAPFEVTFDHLMSFQRAVALIGDENPGLMRLERMLGEALEKAKLGGPNRHFKPHVTLMYDEMSFPVQLVRPAITWTVREFVLIHSLVGKSQYVPCRVFPLQG